MLHITAGIRIDDNATDRFAHDQAGDGVTAFVNECGKKLKRQKDHAGKREKI